MKLFFLTGLKLYERRAMKQNRLGKLQLKEQLQSELRNTSAAKFNGKTYKQRTIFTKRFIA